MSQQQLRQTIAAMLQDYFAQKCAEIKKLWQIATTLIEGSPLKHLYEYLEMVLRAFERKDWEGVYLFSEYFAGEFDAVVLGIT